MAKTWIHPHQKGDSLLLYKDLFSLLVLRDLRLRYRQTALGIAWILLQPLLPTLIFALFLGKWMASIPSNAPYFLFALAGWVPWTLFSSSLQRSSMSLIAEASLIAKIYFPRLLLPLSSAASALLDFSISTLVLLLIALFSGVSPRVEWVLFPLFGALLWILSTSFGLIFSLLALSYRDFANLLPFALQMGMFATPVFYPLSLVSPKWSLLYCLNPAVGLFEAGRWALFPEYPISLPLTLYSISFTALFSALSYYVFRKAEFQLADRI